MTAQRKYWLIKDVVSYFAPYTPYGIAGTEVIILHDHYDMKVVKDLAGNVFHSRTDNLTDVPPNSPSPLKTEKPVEQPVAKSRAHKKKALPPEQNTLF